MFLLDCCFVFLKQCNTWLKNKWVPDHIIFYVVFSILLLLTNPILNGPSYSVVRDCLLMALGKLLGSLFNAKRGVRDSQSQSSTQEPLILAQLAHLSIFLVTVVSYLNLLNKILCTRYTGSSSCYFPHYGIVAEADRIYIKNIQNYPRTRPSLKFRHVHACSQIIRQMCR